MRIASLLPLSCVFLSLLALPAWAGEVQLEKKNDQVVVKIGGEHFTTYNFSDSQAKPYFHPVYAPGKVMVVREKVFDAEGQQGNDSKTGMGHFHHKGLWIAIDSVNEAGLNYWHERNRIVNKKIETSQQGENGILKVTNHWLDNDGQPLLKEVTEYTITPDRLIVCNLTLTALDKPVTFGDTKEGLFAIRLHYDLRGLSGGDIINASGAEGENETWGKPSPWIDYHGQVKGNPVGVSLFDDPDNFRPSRYHVRGYGLFAINPFGEKKYSNGKEEADEVTLEPGESVSLRYGLYVHEGDEKEANVAGKYDEFLGMN